MVKRIFLLALVLILTLPAEAAPAAGTREVTHYTMRGLYAFAEFDSLDETGCVETWVFVSADDGKVKQDRKPAVGSWMSIVIDRYDFCKNQDLLYASAYPSLEPNDFVISKKLASASLSTTVTVQDEMHGVSFPVTVGVEWIGTGEPSYQKFIEHFLGPGYREVFRHFGFSRDAAATGSVHSTEVEFISSASVDANMQNFRNADLWIYKRSD